jgi:hypothetical protein
MRGNAQCIFKYPINPKAYAHRIGRRIKMNIGSARKKACAENAIYKTNAIGQVLGMGKKV